MTIDTLFFCVIKLQIEQSAIQLASYNHAMQCKSARTVNYMKNYGYVCCIWLNGSVCVHTPHIYAHVCIHPYAYRLTTQRKSHARA